MCPGKLSTITFVPRRSFHLVMRRRNRIENTKDRRKACARTTRKKFRNKYPRARERAHLAIDYGAGLLSLRLFDLVKLFSWDAMLNGSEIIPGRAVVPELRRLKWNRCKIRSVIDNKSPRLDFLDAFYCPFYGFVMDTWLGDELDSDGTA